MFSNLFVSWFFFMVDLFIIVVAQSGTASPMIASHVNNIIMQMPNVTLKKVDEYICIYHDFSSMLLDNGVFYLNAFQPLFNRNEVHHMIVMLGDDDPPSNKHTRNCYGPRGDVIYSWGNEAQGLALPASMGFEVNAKRRLLTIQFHYKNILPYPANSSLKIQYVRGKPEHTMSILLMHNSYFKIPPNRVSHNVSASCRFSYRSASVYAVRVHAHNFAKVIVIWYKRKEDFHWSYLLARSPHRQQNYFELPKHRRVALHEGDQLAMKCYYSTVNHNSSVTDGWGQNDEMCNGYLLLYNITEVPPPSPDQFFFTGFFNRPNDCSITSYVKEIPDICDSYVTLIWDFKSIGEQVVDLAFARAEVGTTKQKLLIALTRGDRTWDFSSFSYNHVWRGDESEIKKPVLHLFSTTKNHHMLLLSKAGRNLLFLPHSLTIVDDTMYFTDVSSHQIVQYNFTSNTAVRRVGSKLEPGDDSDHYCKPADVAVSADEVFVADGYCNNRIQVYDRETMKFKYSFGQKLGLNVVHCVEYRDGYLFVCDRQNGQILIFDVTSASETSDPHLLCIINSEQLRLSVVYDIHLIDKADFFFAVGYHETKPALVLFDYSEMFGAQYYIPTVSPHSVLADSQRVYVSDIGANPGIWYSDIVEVLDCFVLAKRYQSNKYCFDTSSKALHSDFRSIYTTVKPPPSDNGNDDEVPSDNSLISDSAAGKNAAFLSLSQFLSCSIFYRIF